MFRYKIEVPIFYLKSKLHGEEIRPNVLGGPFFVRGRSLGWFGMDEDVTALVFDPES